MEQGSETRSPPEFDVRNYEPEHQYKKMVFQYHPDILINRIITTLHKPSKTRHQSDFNCILPILKNVTYFKEQNVQSKDLSDVCELLTYQFLRKGERIYSFDEPKDSMYIVIDGSVSFDLDMKDN